MNIVGKRILLRELRKEDMSLLNQLINDYDICQNVVGWSKPVTMEEQINWFKNLENDKNIRYAICDKKKQDIIIGTIVISKIDWKNRSCSVDIKISKNKQKKGYGKSAINLVINYVFKELNLNRIAVNILESNVGSRRVFEACGFKIEGIQKQAIYKNGKYNTLINYAILKKEFINNERNR